MTEAAVVSAASPEVQAQAEKLGWIPPTRFKGDPERFIDAEDFIERGETILPIVKEQNRRLQAEVAALRAGQAKTEEALAAATKAIEEIEERHTVATQRAVEAAREQVKAQLAAASEEGDHRGVAELTDQLTKLNVAVPEKAASTPKPAPTVPVFTPPADLQAWNDENPWFGKDKRKTALALAIAQELREGGESSTGRRFFDKVKETLDADYGDREPSSSKVEGARNGSESDARSGAKGGKGWSALPAEARAACDADSRNFVGPNKRYKTQQEWRNRYAQLYFEGA